MDTRWCTLSVTPEIEDMVRQMRDNECALAAAPAFVRDARALERTLVGKDVDAAQELSADTALSDEELASRCLVLSGPPWDQAPQRRDMRERVRIWRRLASGEGSIPATLDDLFALRGEAMAAEVPVYREASTPRLRTAIAFAHGATPFEQGALPPGKETVAPELIGREILGWLSSLASGTDKGFSLETRALEALFVFELIHPFRDGNGRTGRMLLCDMLAARYSVPTLLAFVGKLQANRRRIGQTTAAIVRERTDIAPFVELYLGLALEAQKDVLGMVGA